MPKMRGFKPEIWTDDKFVSLSPLARLLFMGLWTYACDNGHVEDKPQQIRMRVLPADDCDVSKLLDEIAKLGMAKRSQGVITIPKLAIHQRIDKRYFTTCEHCGPTDDTTGTRSGHDVSTTGARSGHALKEGRKEGEGECESTTASHARKKPSTTIPDDWSPSDTHQQYAREHSLDLSSESFRFRNHALTNDRRVVRWDAAFSNWLSKAQPTKTPAARGQMPEGW